MGVSINLKKLIISLLAVVMLVGCTVNTNQPTTDAEEPQKTLTANMTEHQKDIFQEILARVLRNRNNLTPETHRQFWELVDEVGATEEELATMKDLLAGPIVIYMKYFFEDALISLEHGTPYKSVDREKYEQHLKSLEAITEFRIEENNKLMEQIAYKQPIQQGSQSAVMDEAMIKQALINVNLAMETINQLFTRPS
ncbi:hypothetical protein [Paenibacillus lignilyticus]|uniref:Lipoprotein n=1 Tax=Paenibacillus lignilyticus TaxID=1172615 RepID=A0ABS5CDY4_9BACL|nr:hypothetical protein [Paenibacillus lignilyticus]MBP3964050.1 hypothetical protein [Paenibacillus lignilyticus]